MWEIPHNGGHQGVEKGDWGGQAGLGGGRGRCWEGGKMVVSR